MNQAIHICKDLPLFENKTKRCIIDQFNSGEELTAKTVYQRLVDECNLDITYQGVHKHLQQLLKWEILSKNDDFYSLSENWIKGMKKYSEMISSREK